MNEGSDFRPLRILATSRTVLPEQLSQVKSRREHISGEGGNSTGVRSQDSH